MHFPRVRDELEDWGDLPLDSEDKDKLGLGRDVEGPFLLAQAAEADLLTLGIAIFLGIGLGPLEGSFFSFPIGLYWKDSSV